MSVPRKVAAKLLRAVVRHMPADSQCWGDAMLREMDFIESDWAAFSWALGSTAATLRYLIPRTAAAWVETHSYLWKELRVRTIGRKAAGLASGVVFSIGVVAASILGLTRGSLLLVPEWHLAQMPWAQFMSVLGIPETVFFIAAVALWRKSRTVSTGILFSAITLMTHFIVYVSSH